MGLEAIVGNCVPSTGSMFKVQSEGRLTVRFCHATWRLMSRVGPVQDLDRDSSIRLEEKKRTGYFFVEKSVAKIRGTLLTKAN
jgi:hypothetical protein